LASYGRPIRRNSVLEELRVKRLAVLKRMLKLSDAGVENRWTEREEKLCRQHRGGGLRRVVK